MTKLFPVIALLALSACSSTQHKPIPDDPYYAPVYPEAPATKVEQTGSMYQASQAASLYSDIRAHRAGDIITIMLEESTSAKKSAANEIKKGSNASLSPITAGGNSITVNGQTLDMSYKDDMNTKRESDADQSNSLTGKISANVMKVLSNGNLVVRGEKWITINNGDEFIRVTGIVRAQDISPDNTVASHRIANARIQYSGSGTFADAQKVGWLGRFFLSDWWPF